MAEENAAPPLKDWEILQKKVSLRGFGVTTPESAVHLNILRHHLCFPTEFCSNCTALLLLLSALQGNVAAMPYTTVSVHRYDTS